MCAPSLPQVNISVLLIGENSSPVSASVTVSQRAAPGAGGAPPPAELVMDEALFWDVGEYGSVKTVSVRLPDKVRAPWVQGICMNLTSPTLNPPRFPVVDAGEYGSVKTASVRLPDKVRSLGRGLGFMQKPYIINPKPSNSPLIWGAGMSMAASRRSAWSFMKAEQYTEPSQRPWPRSCRVRPAGSRSGHCW